MSDSGANWTPGDPNAFKIEDIAWMENVYSPAMGKPDAARQSSKTFALKELPDLVAARTTAWAITLACGDAGRVSEALAAAEAGYAVPTRSFVVLPDALRLDRRLPMIAMVA